MASASSSAKLVSLFPLCCFCPLSACVSVRACERRERESVCVRTRARGCVSVLVFIASLTGKIGEFNFQVLLLSLTSSVALLAVATSVVNCLAFFFLPLRFIYRQYRTLDVRGSRSCVCECECVCECACVYVNVSVSVIEHEKFVCVCAPAWGVLVCCVCAPICIYPLNDFVVMHADDRLF